MSLLIKIPSGGSEVKMYLISDEDNYTDSYLYHGFIHPDGSWWISKCGKVQQMKLDKTNGFADPVPSDIGKMVQANSVDVGLLWTYEIDPYGVDTGKWRIRAMETIADGSAMTITDGTGAGTADGNSSPTNQDLDWCDRVYAHGKSDYAANWANRANLTYLSNEDMSYPDSILICESYFLSINK